MREYKTIFAGVDFTPLGQLAAKTAVELAGQLQAHRVHWVHVASATAGWAIGAFDGSEAYANAARIVYEASARALEELSVGPTRAQVTRELRAGIVARELAASALEHRADIAVIASHHRGRVGRFVLGSVASTFVRASPCPVLVVGADRPLRPENRTVLAAIDGSVISELVLEHAFALASKTRATVRVLSVLDVDSVVKNVPVSSRPEVAEMIDLVEARYRVEIERLAKRARCGDVELIVDVRIGDDAKQTILQAAASLNPDLLVIGSSGHSAWARMTLGSTATRVVAEAPQPILVVPSAR